MDQSRSGASYLERVCESMNDVLGMQAGLQYVSYKNYKGAPLPNQYQQHAKHFLLIYKLR